MKGLDQFKHPTMRTLPLVLRGASKIGWYEGSGFFLITSMSLSTVFLCNYMLLLFSKWLPMVRLINRLIARYPQLQMVADRHL